MPVTCCSGCSEVRTLHIYFHDNRRRLQKPRGFRQPPPDLSIFFFYSSSGASSTGAAFSRAFMLREIFLSSPLKSTTLA